MSSAATYEEINESKAQMGHIYDQPDPRAYFRELRKLGYAIPGAAKPVFRKLISLLKRRRNDTLHILDLGCSYGVNAALLKYDLSMPDLYEHWDRASLAGAATKDLATYDQQFFENLNERDDISVVGLDAAGAAVTFAEQSGLLDEGHAVNLEKEPLPEAAKRDLASVDLMISTGCIGYVTEKSFERLLPVVTQGQSPWMGNFVLRMFPFESIEETLKDWGYVTEKLEGQTFVQRRFASEEEQQHLLGQLRKAGIEPTQREMEGKLLAEFYLSRPAHEAAEAPIEQLLST